MTTTAQWRRARRATLLVLAPALGGALVAAPALAARHHDTLHADHGFVVAVANNDAFVKVKTSDHGDVTLTTHSKSLRQQIDAVSVTDYVEVSYDQVHKGKLVLKSLHDTSASDSGTVVSIASSHKLVDVKTAAHGTLKLHVLKLDLLDGVKAHEKVDVDFYKDAADQDVLVNIGRRAPIGSGSGKGGTGKGGKGGKGGSAGSSGSSGSYGSSGSFGSGSSGSSGSWGSSGSGSSSDA